MSQADVKPRDVFISWTGEDAAFKDAVAKKLEEGGITVLISDMHCHGNFVDWSRAAATSAAVYMPIITPAALKSKGMLWELEEIHNKLCDPDTAPQWKKRIVPVCADLDLYESFDRFGDLIGNKISAVTTETKEDTKNPSEHFLNKIYVGASLGITACFFDEYRRRAASEFIRVAVLYDDLCDRQDQNFDFGSLYLERSITETEGKGKTYNSPRVMMSEGSVSFVCGAAGSGKSRYIDQIHSTAASDELVLSLECSRACASEESIFSLMYKKFHAVCGEKRFFTPEDFGRMLEEKKLILVLDGMDEITTQSATELFCRKVEEYFLSARDSTCLIFTGRNRKDISRLVIADAPTVKYRLDPLDNAGVYTLAERLFALLGSPEKSGEFCESIRTLDSDIRTNPLLLSQLAAIYNATGDIPRTTAGILEAVLRITLNLEDRKRVAAVPALYRDMVENDLDTLLSLFARKKYLSMSAQEGLSADELMEEALCELYDENSPALEKRARFINDYLQNRAILDKGEFGHKMFLEYLTAVSYYNDSFRARAINRPEVIKELFTHYSDPYWEAVIRLFLAKADSVINSRRTRELYELIGEMGICEYTLLFEACREAVHRGDVAKLVLVTDILKKSADGTYPPYGPLFWYVPTYTLYPQVIKAASELNANPQAAALARDVCYIMGGYNRADEIDTEIDGMAIFDACGGSLTGVRRAVCGLFYTGNCDFEPQGGIYPRCFDPSQARLRLERGCESFGRMTEPFEDELGLYTHEMYSELDGEYIGIVCAPYDKDRISARLGMKSTDKLCGLFLSNGQSREIDYIPFDRTSVKVLCLPENTLSASRDYSLHMPLIHSIAVSGEGLIYFGDTLYIEGAHEVCDGMFTGCHTLKRAVLSDEIHYLGAHAFRDCKKLESVHLPKSITEIQDFCFFGCHSLCDIVLPDGIGKIGSNAFWGCLSLSAVNIPDGVHTIDDGAFNRCENLMVLTLPDSVRVIGEDAFSGCERLLTLTVPEGVTRLRGMAFQGCTSLRNVALPKTLTKLDSYVFGGCESLSDISLPEGLLEIGGGAFENCTSLTKLNIPQSVQKIGLMAFGGCSGLKKISLPDGLRGISNGLLNGCSALESVTLPPHIEYIGQNAFGDCTSLESIAIPHGVSEIGHRAFLNCTRLTEIVIPDSVEYIGFGEFLGEATHVFAGCSSLKHITIPDSVKELGKGAFEDCDSLESIILPEKFGDLTRHLGLTFRTRVILSEKKITACVQDVPHGITHIKEGEFQDRTDITCVNLPEGVVFIGENAFYGCEALEEIRLPESLTEIGEHAFCACTKLKKITLPAGVSVLENGVFECCTLLEEVHTKGVITRIGAHAFEGCESLGGFDFGGVTLIDEYAFCGCESLESALLPETLCAMGKGAFEGCNSLYQVNIPASVTVIPTEAFNACSALDEVNIPEGIISIGTAAFKYCDALRRVTLPHGLDIISTEAFGGCDLLTDIQLPDGLKIIGRHAFEGCASLKSIVIPQSVQALGINNAEGDQSVFEDGGVFCGCSALESAQLLCSIDIICHDAFKNCESLKHISLPDSVTQIGMSAFSGCGSLEDIKLPDCLEGIGVYAFADCRALRHITLPAGIKDISIGLFEGCSALESVSLPDTLEGISRAAFKKCGSLKAIELGHNLRRIGQNAFVECVSLERVRLSRNFRDSLSLIFGEIDPKIVEFI